MEVSGRTSSPTCPWQDSRMSRSLTGSPTNLRRRLAEYCRSVRPQLRSRSWTIVRDAGRLAQRSAWGVCDRACHLPRRILANLVVRWCWPPGERQCHFAVPECSDWRCWPRFKLRTAPLKRCSVMGYVAAKNANPKRLEVFKQGMTQLGYAEGKNIRIEYREA